MTDQAQVSELQMLCDAVIAHAKSGATSDEPLWDKHYADDFESIEADGMTHKGRAEVKGKHEYWFSAHEVHSFDVLGSFVGHDGFGIMYEIDVEAKDGSFPRTKMSELAVYTVENGKIIRESFWMAPNACG